MKTKIVLCFLFVGLMTTGASCVNENAVVSVDFPVNYQYAINPGPNTTFNQSQTVIVTDQVAASYRDKIKNARYYDVRVWVSGAYTGSVTGSGYINNIKLLDFSGLWSDFSTPQSLLGNSTHITLQPQGKAELLRILGLVSSSPQTTLTGSAIGSVSQGPVPSGLSIHIDIYAQADSQI
jgi:hypothetical protein